MREEIEVREPAATTEPVQETRTVYRKTDDASPRDTKAERAVWLIAGIIIALLAFRFVLSLLGANRENVFASLVYGLSYPFAAPFFGLFGYNVQYGVSRFEFETLIAIAVYALLAWGIASAIRTMRR